jgi:SpoVK/Ycf46/Vps4 family AAA+-type ATPase
MYVGEGEEKLRDAFRRARLAAPSIIFIDEIDAVVGRRPSGSGAARELDMSSRLLSSFLTEMDGMELATGITVLATTNRPKALDPALLRPGRFDYVVFVPPPDIQGRLAALKVHTAKMPLAEDVVLESIAEETELFTGAELAGVCREAALCALREATIPFNSTNITTTSTTTTTSIDATGTNISKSQQQQQQRQRFSKEVSEVAMRHFKAAVRAIRPGLTPEILAEYADWPPKKGR